MGDIRKKRVAVIGCGPCGMAFLCAMRSAEMKGEVVPEVVCFEKQGDIGGLWNYTWRTGLDEQGEYVHGSMYRTLWSNAPKECLEMADYTFIDHFKSQIPSYLPRAVLHNYLIGRTKKYNIDKFLKLNTVVRYVQEVNNSFSVRYENIQTGKSSKEIFDYVVVATGHFSIPHLPTYPLDSFNGRILHSHDFRKSEEFRGQTILLIGSSFSAEDIALQLYKYGAKECIISYRSEPLGFNWPISISEVPQLIEAQENECFFKDGSKASVDAIIFCTGYKHHFPFLCENIRLSATNIMFPDKLYKGIVHEGNENVLYLGMQNQFYTFTMFNAQAWFARDYIMGKIEVQNFEKRKEEVAVWYKRGQSLKTAFEAIDFQRDYLSDIWKYTDYPTHDHDNIAVMFKEWMRDKKESILTYRDKCFSSKCDGTMGRKMKLPWIDAKDNSLECFTSEDNYEK